MARTNQRLINYHTSDKTAMPSGSSVDYGEIVVRHNEEAPELLIKVGTDSFGVFQASGAVNTAINTAVSIAKSALEKSISDLETSLSGHVGTFDKFKENVEKTYATKEELKSASGSIITAYTKMIGDAKLEAIGTASGYTDTQVSAAEERLNTAITDVASDLDALSEVVESISTNIGDNYVTSADLKTTVETLEGKISTAKDDAISSGKTYTDAQIVAAKSYTDTQIKTSETTTKGLIDGVASDLDKLDKTVAANKKYVEDNYVLTTTLNNKVSDLTSSIATAKAEAIGDASAYTDTQFAAAKEYSDGKLSAATETLKGNIANVSSSVSTLSANVHTTITNVQTALTQTINNKVATAYRYQGSVDDYADLPKNLTSGETGYVYNVANANGHIPAGTNYAWNGTAWDALGGIVDLTPYAKASDVKTTVEGINQRIEGVESSVNTLSGNTDSAIASLKKYADGTFATKTALQTAQDNITTAYTKDIADAKAAAIGTASGYTDTQVLAAKNKLNQSIETVDGRVTSLSGVTETVKATADSAVQSATVNSNAKVTKTGTTLDFDFSGLIINCGDF